GETGLELVAPKGEVLPRALLALSRDPGLRESLQVVARGRLGGGQVQLMAGPPLGAPPRRELGHDLEPERIGERLQDRQKLNVVQIRMGLGRSCFSLDHCLTYIEQVCT